MTTISDLKDELDAIKKTLDEIKGLLGGGGGGASAGAGPLIPPTGTFLRVDAGHLHPRLRHEMGLPETGAALIIPLPERGHGSARD